MYRTITILFVLFIAFTVTSLPQWNAIGPDSGETSFCMSFDNNTGNLFLGTAEGFWYYNISTAQWTRREDVGWIGRSVFSIAAHPTIPGRIITGRQNAFFKGYIEYTNDWGVTNDNAYNSDGGQVTDIKGVPGSPNTFIACTWPDVSPGELVKSTDGGLNWVLQTNYIHFALTEIAIDKNNPQIMYIAGDERVTKSTNGGTSWTVSANGLPSGLGVYTVSVSPTNSQILLASNDNDLYRSTDAGGSWTSVYGSACRRTEFNPVNGNYAIALTFSPYKVLISSNAGAAWSDFTAGFNPDELSDLAFNASGTKLYVSTSMMGVYVHDFSFVPVELVSFTAAYNSGAVDLRWQTATELNNHGFEIQRSFGNNSWTTIGFIKGEGTSSLPVTYSYTDHPETNSGSKVTYRLKQLDLDGSFKYSGEVEVVTQQPYSFALEQNYPNPFNPTTTIEFTIPSEREVSLVLYNSMGEEIKVLLNNILREGKHTLQFDGSELSSGMYLLMLKSGSESVSRKLMLMK